jgi:hypothetical protein
MSTPEVTLKSVEALTIAGIRELVPDIDQMPARCSILFDTIAGWLVANKLPFGSSMTIYFNDSYTRQNIDMECAFIIPAQVATKALAAEAPIVIHHLDAVAEMAVTIVTDDFHQQVDGLTPVYHSLARWIEAHH